MQTLAQLSGLVPLLLAFSVPKWPPALQSDTVASLIVDFSFPLNPGLFSSRLAPAGKEKRLKALAEKKLVCNFAAASREVNFISSFLIVTHNVLRFCKEARDLW